MMGRGIAGFCLVLALLGGSYLCSGAIVNNPDVQEVTERMPVNYPANAFVINEDGSCTWKDYVRVFTVRNVESVQDCYNAIRVEVQLGTVVKSAVRKEYSQWTRRASRIEIRKATKDGAEFFEVSAYYEPVTVPPINL